MPGVLSLPVVWSEDGGPVAPGRLDLSAVRLHLDGGYRDDRRTCEFALSEIAAVRIGRSGGERINGRQALMVELADGRTVSFAGVDRPGALHELAERLQRGSGLSR